MTRNDFFEAELSHIMEHVNTDFEVRYAGGSAYMTNGQNVVRVMFHNSFSVDNFDALKVYVVNKDDGKIDTSYVKFTNALGLKYGNASVGKIGPHIWVDREPHWAFYQPVEDDYKKLAETIQLMIDLYL